MLTRIEFFGSVEVSDCFIVVVELLVDFTSLDVGFGVVVF